MKTIPAALARHPSVPVLGAFITLLHLRRRPLWKADTCCDYLDITKPALLRLVDDGGLPWAFDIGTPGRRIRKAIRVLAHCIVERGHGPIKSIGPTANLKFTDVIEIVLPHHRPGVKGTDLQRMLSCTAQHIMDLSQCREIRLNQEPHSKSGPNASPHFCRDSVIRFLEKRRML